MSIVADSAFCAGCGRNLAAPGASTGRRGASRWLLVLAGLVVAAGAVGTILLISGQQSVDSPEYRTHYESLALDTPENAVAVFSDAFARQDYLTTYLVFAPTAQLRVQQYASVFQFGSLVDVSAFESPASFHQRLPSLTEGEHVLGDWYLLDRVMTAASQESAFLVDLSAKVTATGSSAGPVVDGTATVDVATKVAGVPGEVIFRMVQVPSGAWRVRQVIVPGGDEEQIPWSVPADPVPEKTVYLIPFWAPCPEAGFESPENPVSGPSIAADPDCAQPEEVVTVWGAGFEPGLEGTVYFVPDSEIDIHLPQGRISIDDAGRFEMTFIVPRRPSDLVQHIEVAVWAPIDG